MTIESVRQSSSLDHALKISPIIAIQQNSEPRNKVQLEKIEHKSDSQPVPLATDLETELLSTSTPAGIELEVLPIFDSVAAPVPAVTIPNCDKPDVSHTNYKYPKPVSTTGWIKPKVNPSIKKKYFSPQPKASETSSTSSNVSPNQKIQSAPAQYSNRTESPSASSSRWTMEVTRPATNGQKVVQKKMKQSTLFDMSRNFPPQTVDLSTLAGYAGGERKIINFGTAPSPPPAPVPSSSATSFSILPLVNGNKKRKSEDLDTTFGSEDEELFCSPPIPTNSVRSRNPETKENKENKVQHEENENDDEWTDETFFDDPFLNNYLDKKTTETEENHLTSPLPIASPTTPVKRQGVLSLRNKRKDDLVSTMDIIADFDKYGNKYHFKV